MKEQLETNHLTFCNGIYFTSNNENKISFPDDGHKLLAKIEENSFWFKHRNKIIKSACNKHNVNGLFYDIGGGNGFVSLNIQNSQITPVLIEPMIDGALIAQKRGIQNIICSDLKSLEFKSKIKYAGAFDVIEHIEDDLDFLNTINEAMDKKGFLFITVPAFKFLWSEVDEESGHYRRYTKAQLKHILKKSNFEVLEAKYFFTYLLPAMLILGRKNKNNTDSEHKPNSFIQFVITLLNTIDLLLFNILKGLIPGASILVVAQKK